MRRVVGGQLFEPQIVMKLCVSRKSDQVVTDGTNTRKASWQTDLLYFYVFRLDFFME